MLDQKIFKDYIQAVKVRDTLKAATLSFLRAQIKNESIAKKTKTLEDQEVFRIIQKQVKQRQDAIEQFQKGGREDLAEKEGKELAILKSYLPQELSIEEIQSIIRQSMDQVQASGLKDMGSVMKAVLPKLSGQADSKTVSALVKKELQQVGA